MDGYLTIGNKWSLFKQFYSDPNYYGRGLSKKQTVSCNG